jgi:hypothetical protein
VLRITALAAVLLLACLGGSAQGASSGRLTVRTAMTKAKLRLRVSSTRAHTTVRVRGRVRVRARRTRLVLVRCLNVPCTRRSRRHRSKRSLRRGRYRLKRSLRTIRTNVVRVELRRGRRVLASVRLRSPVRAPTRPPALTRPSPPGDSPAPAPKLPSRFSLRADPGLKPAYNPDVPDYSVSCEPGETVKVTAAVPAGQSVEIDGHKSGPGTVAPSVALQTGQSFRFTVSDASGTHQHGVRCTPQDFPTWTVIRDGTPQVDWLTFTPSLGTGGSPYSIIADNHGVPVWWNRPPADNPIDAKVLPDGTVAWARHLPGGFSETSYAHYALDGTELGSLAPAGGSVDHHDLQQLPNGDYLALAYVPRENVDLTSVGGPASATVLDAEILEITAGGTVVWSWNSRDHIDLHETDSWGLNKSKTTYHGQPAYDLVHINSVEQTGATVVFSGRHLNAVYGIRRSDGAIEWKVGGIARPESLAITGDPLGPTSFGGEHDARLLGDGSLTIHDNGTLRDRPPRAVRYSLDTTARTANLMEQVTDSRIASSSCCGSARRLPGGHWVMSWGGEGTITELTAAGAPVLTLSLDGGFSYRAQPVSSQLLSRSALRAGMNAQYPR